MICCICNFEISVWYKYGHRWYCWECYQKQRKKLGMTYEIEGIEK